jgi:DUF1365 family protein
MTALPEPCLYVGKVMHARLKPARHRFVYRVFSLFLNLDQLETTARKLRLFSVDRFNVLSFHAKDHGDGSGDLKNWIRGHLRSAGYAGDGPIYIQCYPRLWGYVFNPLSVYYCYTSNGSLEAILHEVSNTFGDRHSYLLPVSANGEPGPIFQSCAKKLYVSPFNPVDHRYDFKVREPDDRYAIAIREFDSEGEVLVATFDGRRRALTNGALLRAVLAHPLMTLKVIVAIHWEAFRLWRKGVPVAKRLEQSIGEISIQGPADAADATNVHPAMIQTPELRVFSR